MEEKNRRRRANMASVVESQAGGGVVVDEYIPIVTAGSGSYPANTLANDNGADMYSSASENSSEYSRGGRGSVVRDLDHDGRRSNGIRTRDRNRNRAHARGNGDGDEDGNDGESSLWTWTWRDSLDLFRREVADDGGRLVDVDAVSMSAAVAEKSRCGNADGDVDGDGDWNVHVDGDESPHGTLNRQQPPQANHSSSNASSTRTRINPRLRNRDRTRTLVPLTPLPYLSHGLHPIHVPGGSYADVRVRLWVNLNLGRGGCAGRSWVGLDCPR